MSSIIHQIMSLASQVVEQGGHTKLVACLNKTFKAQFDKEVQEILKVERFVAIIDTNSATKDPTIHGNGFSVRVALDPFVPLDRLWVIPEPNIDNMLKSLTWPTLNTPTD